MRIACVIYRMEGGGAERVLSVLANYWAQNGKEVTLFTMDDGTLPSFYDLHPAVHYRPLDLFAIPSNLAERLWNIIARTLKLRRAIRKLSPDVVIPFMDMTNIRTLISTLGLSIPVIISERTLPTESFQGKAWGWKWLRRFLYGRAAKLVSVGKGVDASFDFLPKHKRAVINGPNFFPSGLEKKAYEYNNETDRKNLVTLGGLRWVKGHDFLLTAFAKISGKHPQWVLTIWGEGEMRPELEKLRDRLGLTDRVHLPGTTKKTWEKLREADLFVLSSRKEGLGNVLLESMACGLPVVSFDCPTGPREIIRDGLDGVLVPPEDVDALAETLDRLMGDENKRKELARKAPEVTERFSFDNVMGQWERLLHEVIDGK